MKKKRPLNVETTSSSDVVVIGGGLAGLAAAAALTRNKNDRTLRVQLFEGRRQWGGRAGAYLDAESGESVDHCQHVAMGCCREFLALTQEFSLQDCLAKYETIPFRFEDGSEVVLSAMPAVPAPLHLGGFLWKFPGLRRLERLRLVRALWNLKRLKRCPVIPMVHWLREQAQSERTVRLFWEPILVSALGDQLERLSLAACRHVLVTGFMAGRDAFHLHVPSVPLDELYRRMAEQLQLRGVQLRMGERVSALSPVAGKPRWKMEARGPSGGRSEIVADAVICAVASYDLAQVIARDAWERAETFSRASDIEYAPITSIHLWLKVDFLSAPQIVLPGGFVDWIFRRASDGDRQGDTADATYYFQCVISGSRDLRGRSDASIVDEAIEQIQRHWPVVRRESVERYKVITQPRAAITMSPEVESKRPTQRTDLPGLFLAGDYTHTGWPSTMEGAVRSGNLAAAAVVDFLASQAATATKHAGPLL